MFRLLHDLCRHIWKMIKHLSNGTERITFCFLFNLYLFFFLSNRIWDSNSWLFTKLKIMIVFFLLLLLFLFQSSVENSSSQQDTFYLSNLFSLPMENPFSSDIILSFSVLFPLMCCRRFQTWMCRSWWWSL